MTDSSNTRNFFGTEASDYYSRNYEAPRNRHEFTLALRREACLEMLPAVQGRVLDLGCGPGAMTVPMIRRGHRVVAVDFSTEMVAQAAKRIRALGVEPEVATADATALPFTAGCFAAVVTTGVLEYIDDLPRALAEISRVLEPGGTLIATMSLPRRLERAAVRLAAFLKGSPPAVTQYIYGRHDFDRVVEAAGFRINDRRCSSFAPFPLDAIWPKGVVTIDARLGDLLNRFDVACDHAKTYIVRARTR